MDAMDEEGGHVPAEVWEKVSTTKPRWQKMMDRGRDYIKMGEALLADGMKEKLQEEEKSKSA